MSNQRKVAFLFVEGMNAMEREGLGATLKDLGLKFAIAYNNEGLNVVAVDAPQVPASVLRELEKDDIAHQTVSQTAHDSNEKMDPDHQREHLAHCLATTMF